MGFISVENRMKKSESENKGARFGWQHTERVIKRILATKVKMAQTELAVRPFNQPLLRFREKELLKTHRIT